jgi:hypothetical protein
MASGGAYIFGGHNGSHVFGKIYSWTGSDWNNVTPAMSYSVCLPAAGYHPSLDIVASMGGDNGTHFFQNTFEFQTDKWVDNTDTPAPPARYYNANMAYDPVSEVLIMFGGYGVSGSLNDTWKYKAKQ